MSTLSAPLTAPMPMKALRHLRTASTSSCRSAVFISSCVRVFPDPIRTGPAERGLEHESQSGIGNEKGAPPASSLAPHLAIQQDTILARRLLRRCYIPLPEFFTASG